MPPWTYELTTSMIRSYKACRRKFDLEYRELLKPEVTPDALATGTSYHAKLEQVLSGGEFTPTGDRTDAMARAFQRFVLPELPAVKAVEQKFRFRLAPGIYLLGKIDALTTDGIPIEHKSAGVTPDESYIYRLNWDEQVATYMLATGKTELIYTVCQKPTIRPKQGEGMEDFIKRCDEWYDATKAATFRIQRSAAELQAKREELISLSREMRRQTQYFRNPSHCQIMGCSYSPICLDYNPEFILGFEKKQSRNEELIEL